MTNDLQNKMFQELLGKEVFEAAKLGRLRICRQYV